MRREKGQREARDPAREPCALTRLPSLPPDSRCRGSVPPGRPLHPRMLTGWAGAGPEAGAETWVYSATIITGDFLSSASRESAPVQTLSLICRIGL